METHWMYDQFSAPSENDWVGYLRANPPSSSVGGTFGVDSYAGDAYAIQTMRNHWSGYYTPDMLEDLVKHGINSARIAVGYWMFDTPVVHAPGKQSDATNQDALILNWEGCRCAMNAHQTCDWVAFGDSKTCTDKRRPPTMYDFGFNAEGFVTGGLNYLEKMIPAFKAWSIDLLIDLHAAPSGTTHLNSYPGVWVSDVGNFWNARYAAFGGAAKPLKYEAAPAANCGLQGGQFIDPRTWEGNEGCALDKASQGNRTACSCGPGVRGTGTPNLPGHVEDKEKNRWYLSARSEEQCAVDASTGVKFSTQADSVSHKAPWSYAQTKLPLNSSCVTWMDVGVQALVTMAQWIVDLQKFSLPGPSQFCNLRKCADVVFALETINEPALGQEPTYTDSIEAFEERVVPTIQQIFDESDATIKLEATLQYTGSPSDFSKFIRDKMEVSFVSVDFHQYYTWNQEVTWCSSPPNETSVINSDAKKCPARTFENVTQTLHKAQSKGAWTPYTKDGIRTYIAEWALAINGDQVSLANGSTNNLFESNGVDNRPAMHKWFMQQKRNWMLAGASGDFYWTARMGSGWEPRADKCEAIQKQAPCQVTESSVTSAYDQSLPTFRFPTWNFFALLKELPFGMKLDQQLIQSEYIHVYI